MNKPIFARTWQDRVALGALIVVGAALFWYGGDLALKTQVLLWAGLLATVALFAQQEKNERAARMADQYFATFMTMQVIAVLLLTPAYTAGAIAEEKDRKTLE